MLVAREIASYEEQSGLSYGNTVARPYYSDLSVNNYTRGTAVTFQTLNATEETLVVDQQKEVSFYVDKLDEIQAKYDFRSDRTQHAAYLLSNTIDAKVLAEVANASITFDNSDLGGAAGNITVTPSNVVQVFSKLKAKMHQNNIEDTQPWCVVVDPMTAANIEQSFVASGFSTADITLKNGYAGDFLGFKIYVSNNLPANKLLACQKGAIDLVVQLEPDVQIVKAPDKSGYNVMVFDLYGVKTFKEGADRMVAVSVA